MNRTLRLSVLGIVMTLALASGARAAKEWDAGYQIGGILDYKVIEIAASSQEGGPSTDTMGWMGDDVDHWIDEDESVPEEEGQEGDDFGGFSEMGCWWTASHGTVTQGSFQTTWTAPYEQGAEAHLEIGVIDLPRSIGAGESGTRDDPGREYFGTVSDGGGAQSAAMPMSAGVKPPNPVAIWVEWHANWSGPTHGDDPANQGHPFSFGPYRSPCGDPQKLGLVNPDTVDPPAWNCTMFGKKGEFVGQMTPVRPGRYFGIAQECAGNVSETIDGTTTITPGGGPDGPQWYARNNTSDAIGKIFMWDAPYIRWSGHEGWGKPSGQERYYKDYLYRIRAFFAGRVCSQPFVWTQRIELLGVRGQDQWLRGHIND